MTTTYYSGPPQTFPARYETVGYRDVFVIVFSAPKYPERFEREEDAQARSARVGRPYHVEHQAVRRRVTP